jgi:hypothetical protein
MKKIHLLAIFVAVALPLAAITAEDSSKTEATGQQQEQGSDMKEMKGKMNKCQMMSGNEKQEMGMCRMKMSMDMGGDHSHHD